VSTGREIAGVDVAAAIGGKRGLFDSGFPGLVFALTYAAGNQWWPANVLRVALVAAVGTALILAVIRVVRHEDRRQTAYGLVGVAVAALIAGGTGNAVNFYLPGLLIQLGYALALLVSIVVGWPLVGVVAGPLLGEGSTWRDDPGRRRLYTRLSWLWFAMFAVRLLVQVPLYRHDEVVALGLVRLLMGWPLYLFVGFVTYTVIRRSPPLVAHLATPDEGLEGVEEDEGVEEPEPDPTDQD
jgi:hypothetical protein